MAKVGGRQAGTPNKNKAFLRKTLRDRFGEDFDAVHRAADAAVKAEEASAKMHDIAMKGRDTEKLQQAVNSCCNTVSAWAKVAEFVEPKLKAIEMDLSSSDGTMSPREIVLRAATAQDNRSHKEAPKEPEPDKAETPKEPEGD